MSCCNVAYCNEAIPFNHTSAIQLSTIQTSSAANYMFRYNSLLSLLTTFMLVISQCRLRDGLLSLATELRPLLLWLVTIVTSFFFRASYSFVLLCKWIWIQGNYRKTKIMKIVPSNSDFLPSNYSRKTYKFVDKIHDHRESLLNNCSRKILKSFHPTRRTCAFRNISISNEGIAVSWGDFWCSWV